LNPGLHPRNYASDNETGRRVDGNEITSGAAVSIREDIDQNAGILRGVSTAQFVERWFSEPELIRKQIKLIQSILFHLVDFGFAE